MSFVYPSFLWALSVLAIPVVIHLFNFRKTTKIYFSNTRLLRQVKQETTQKRKLKQYLVLASRLLFLTFLVFAFAQPFLPADEQATAGKSIVIYVDNSFSMTAPVGDKTRAIDAALGFVNQIVNTFPPETRYKLLTNDFAPFSNSFKTKKEITDLVAQIKPSAVSRTFSEVAGRIEADRIPSEIFFLSDFQKSTLGNLEDVALDSISQWHLVSMPVAVTSNIFIDSVFLENPFMIGGERNAIHVRLRNTGKPVEGLMIKLVINNIQAATSTVQVESNASAETSFDLMSDLKGFNEGRITLNDFPVSFDNDLYFALNSGGKINVVEISGQSKNNYIEKVFGNHSLFSYKRQLSGNVDFSLVNDADLVVLNGIRSFDAPLASLLNSIKLKSKTLLLIPSVDADLNSYASLLPAGKVSIAQDSEMDELERPDFENPFFENVFEEKSNAIAMPRARKFLQWSADRSAILKFKDGFPFVTRSANVFVITTPLEKEFTDFYGHALFVPVMYRIAESVNKQHQKLYYTLSESVVQLKADSLFGEEPVKLVGKQEIVPAQRKTGDAVLMDIPRFAVDAGFYRAMFGKDTLGLIAFDLDKRESELARVNASDVMTLVSGKVSIFEPASAEAFGNEIKERYLGTPLWKYALLLALAFLLAEVLLVRFFR